MRRIPPRPLADDRMAAREVLDRKALNRALLARQHLLRRADLSPAQAVEHLIALQAQSPNAPYYALWSRLEAFEPRALSALIEDRTLARGALLRNTLHLASAGDFQALRPLLAPSASRHMTEGSVHGRALAGLDREAVAKVGRDLIRETPRTNTRLRAALGARWPNRDPASLLAVIHALNALVQLPPRGLWGEGGQPTLALAEDWLGAPRGPKMSLEDLVRRYLAAFGPASVADAQAWSGLSRLAPVFAALRDDLAVFEDENGVELFDLPGAPRPEAVEPAPVRLLGEFDSVILGHADRARILGDLPKGRIMTVNGVIRAVLLVDGFVAGLWKLEVGKDRATVTITPFAALAKAAVQAAEREGQRLLAFASPGVDAEIRWA